MSGSPSTQNRECCLKEKKRLVQELETCHWFSSSYEQHTRCWSNAAKESGKRAKECMIE